MKKNTKVLALAGLGVVTLVGGTFAYYSASQTFNNPFDTSNYGTYSREKFSIEDGNEWKPGAEVDKEVYATNTGDGEVWVRVKFDEAWSRDNTKFKEFNTTQDGFYVPDPTGDAAPLAGNNQVNTTDGLTADDAGSVVYKNFNDANLVNTAGKATARKWYFVDGYYYYTSALAKDESTAMLLDSVTLCGDTDMGKFDNNSYYKVVEKGAAAPVFDASTWTEGECDFDASLKGQTTHADYQQKYGRYIDKDVYTYKENKLDTTKQGYANADYELNITVEFVQADPEAAASVAAPWDWYPGKQ